MDYLLAVYAVTKAAREYAVAGNGPVLETMCYRFGPHTLSGDDPTCATNQTAFGKNGAKRPTHSFPYLLESKGLWSQEKKKR